MFIDEAQIYVKAGEDINVNLPVMVKYYEEELGKMLTPPDYEKIKDFADNYPDGWFEKAVDEVKNSPKAIRTPMSYIAKVMDSWKAEGVNPLDGRKRKGVSKNRGSPQSIRAPEGYTNPDNL